jgi:hypothetical protein
VGVEAEAGGTAVQKVLISMNTAVAQSNSDLAKFAEAAGMGAGEFAAAWKDDAGGAFASFVEGIGRAGDDAVTVLEDLGLNNQRLLRAFLSLGNAGDLLRESIDLGNTAWRENTALTIEASKFYDTLGSDLVELGNLARNVAGEFGAMFADDIRAGGDAINGVLEKMREHMGLLVDLTKSLAIAMGAMGLLMVFKALAASAWLSLIPAIVSLADAFYLLHASLGWIGIIGVVITTLTLGILSWRRAHKGQASELRTIGDAANGAADGIRNLTNAQIAAANHGLADTVSAQTSKAFAQKSDEDFDTVITSEIDALNRSVRDVAVTFARYTPQFESLSAPGGLPVPDDDPFKAPPSGFRGPRFPDKKGGGMLSGAMDALGSGMDQLWAKFGPAGLAIAALFDIVSAALKPLQPVIDALREPLKIVGTLIGQTLAPVLELLVPVVKAVAVAFTIGQQAMGYLIQALGWFIDHLVPDFISNVGQGMEQWGKDMVANSKAARKAIGATNDFTDAITAATVNIPKALPLAFLRQQAGRNNTGTTGGVGTTGVTTGVGGEPHDDDTLMSRRETWNIVVNGAVNAKETAQAVMDEIRRAKGRGQSIELDRHYQLRTT